MMKIQQQISTKYDRLKWNETTERDLSSTILVDYEMKLLDAEEAGNTKRVEVLTKLIKQRKYTPECIQRDVCQTKMELICLEEETNDPSSSDEEGSFNRSSIDSFKTPPAYKSTALVWKIFGQALNLT